MCAAWAYPADAQNCMTQGSSLAGKVMWYYATISLALIGVSLVYVTLACCSQGNDSSVALQEGGSEDKHDYRLHYSRELSRDIEEALQIK